VLPYTDATVETREEFGARVAQTNASELSSTSSQDSPTLQIIDPDDPPWGVFTAVLVFLASFFVLAVASAVALIPYAARRGITPTTPDYGRALSEFALKDPTAVFLQVCSTVPAHLVTLLIVWAVVTRFGRRPFWKTLGWDWGKYFGLWTSLGLGVVLFLASSAVAHFLGGDKLTPLEQVINSSAATRYMIAILATVTAPFVEELVFRGVIYSALQRLIARIASLFGSETDKVPSARARMIGATGAVLLVTVLFAGLHVPQYQTNYGVIAAISLLSLSLTLIRAVSGRLLPCYIVHLVFNGIQSVIIVWQGHAPVVPPEQAAVILLPLLRSFHSLI
jgi:membrane protease YdiL (CAAX protease family)